MTEYERKRQERERRNNARRLAYAMYQRRDESTVKRLAMILNYMPEQLAIDIQSLAEIVDNLPEPEPETD